MRKLWIHIGTPKTGSTAVQRYARMRHPYLKSKGIDFLIRGRRAAYNDLGIHLRGRNRAEALEMGAELKRRIAESEAETIVISSEMFTGGDPALLREALDLEEPFETRILGYFRRQDRYLESNYKQKMKTAKVAPGFDNYLKKFGTATGEYLRIVDTWLAAWPEADFEFRRFEPARFPKGDVVYDFMSLFGLDIEADNKPPADETANPTPSIDLLELMQLVARMRGLDARTIFRAMPIADLPRFTGRAMGHDQARDILGEFEDQNEALRQRYFPDDSVLFATDDLDGPDPEIATPSFTEEQKVMIQALIKSVAENAGIKKR